MGYKHPSGPLDELLLGLIKEACSLVEAAKKGAIATMSMKLSGAATILTRVRQIIQANKYDYTLADWVLGTTKTSIQIAKFKLGAGQTTLKVGNERQADIFFFDAANHLKNSAMELTIYLLGDTRFRGFPEWPVDPPGGGD